MLVSAGKALISFLLWGLSGARVPARVLLVLVTCTPASLAHRFASSSPRLQGGAPGEGLSWAGGRAPTQDEFCPHWLLSAESRPTLLTFIVSSRKLTPMKSPGGNSISVLALNHLSQFWERKAKRMSRAKLPEPWGLALPTEALMPHICANTSAHHALLQQWLISASPPPLTMGTTVPVLQDKKTDIEWGRTGTGLKPNPMLLIRLCLNLQIGTCGLCWTIITFTYLCSCGQAWG